MSSDVSDIAEGVTKGILSFSEEKIKELVRNFRNKKLVFIEDPQTIEVVKEQYRSGENKFYEIYIKDKELLFLVRLGLTLRKIENDQERSQNLRSKIFVKYKVEGLHVAEFVQNGVLNRYVGILIDELDSVEKLEKEIYEILKNIEKYTLFVQRETKPSEIIKNALIKIKSHSPNIFVISGVKSVAEVIRNCEDKLKIALVDYMLESFSSSEKEIFFFKIKNR